MLANKIYTNVDVLQNKVVELQSQGKKIVFTNGCFDLLHAGHVLFLEEARNMGDFLVVAINSNESVSRLKGTLRPIIDQDDRLKVVAALESVDAALLFNELTPENLIKKLLPDILVKGDDYSIESIAGSDIVISKGGCVKTVKFKNLISTSKIINKIKTDKV